VALSKLLYSETLRGILFGPVRAVAGVAHHRTGQDQDRHRAEQDGTGHARSYAIFFAMCYFLICGTFDRAKCAHTHRERRQLCNKEAQTEGTSTSTCKQGRGVYSERANDDERSSGGCVCDAAPSTAAAIAGSATMTIRLCARTKRRTGARIMSWYLRKSELKSFLRQ
jgi:hypothetical protein